MLKRFWCLMLIVSLSVAACSTDTPATANPSNDDNNTVDPTPTAEVQASASNLSITISGDVEASIPPGYAQAELREGQLELFLGDFDKNIFFVLPEDITAGTYDLEAYDEMSSSQTASVTVSVALVPGELSRGVEDYGNSINGGIVTGTLTLDAVGETLSGSFDFTATLQDTADDGSEISKSVTVTGTFQDVTVISGE